VNTRIAHQPPPVHRHRRRHRQPLSLRPSLRLAPPRHAAPYDPSITSDATDAVRVKAERVWTAKADRQRLTRATERLGRIFLTTVVEDTWLLPLKGLTSSCNKVLLRDMLQHLTTTTAGLEATNIVSLFIDI
jgi:hypothetical protein